MLVKCQDRKYLQSATSHKSSCEANRRAECGKSACSVRRGGGWKPATVRFVRLSQRKRGATDRPDLRVWRHSSTLPSRCSDGTIHPHAAQPFVHVKVFIEDGNAIPVRVLSTFRS